MLRNSVVLASKTVVHGQGADPLDIGVRSLQSETSIHVAYVPIAAKRGWLAHGVVPVVGCCRAVNQTLAGRVKHMLTAMSSQEEKQGIKARSPPC
eukprot:485132-Pleurochrysis_carterae.AAC.1